jgi:hypothetical protein
MSLELSRGAQPDQAHAGEISGRVNAVLDAEYPAGGGYPLDLESLGWPRVDRGNATVKLSAYTNEVGQTFIQATPAEALIDSAEIDAADPAAPKLKLVGADGNELPADAPVAGVVVLLDLYRKQPDAAPPADGPLAAA